MKSASIPTDLMPVLSTASLLLGCVAILLAISGVFAFLSLRAQAKREAKKVATKVAQRLSEKVAIDYLQRELPNIVHEYRELAVNAVRHGQSDAIAENESEDD